MGLHGLMIQNVARPFIVSQDALFWHLDGDSLVWTVKYITLSWLYRDAPHVKVIITIPRFTPVQGKLLQSCQREWGSVQLQIEQHIKRSSTLLSLISLYSTRLYTDLPTGLAYASCAFRIIDCHTCFHVQMLLWGNSCCLANLPCSSLRNT